MILVIKDVYDNYAHACIESFNTTICFIRNTIIVC